MFRARIYAQFLTLIFIVAGSYYYAEERAKRKEFEGTLSQRKAMEKRDAWIRELEARDQEEKELQAKKEAKRKRIGHGLANSTLERSEERLRYGVLAAVNELLGR